MPSIIEAIQGLTAEVALLRQAVEGLRDKVDGSAVTEAAKPAARAAGPTWAAEAAAAAAAAAAREAATSSVMPEPKSLEEIETERVRKEVETLLVGLFMAGMDDDTDQGFEAFIDLMHSDRTDAPRSIPSLREFTWKTLRRNLARYLATPGDPTSYSVVRWDPEKPRAKDKNVKLFVACPQRSPVPVNFRRDPAHDDCWRITDSSL